MFETRNGGSKSQMDSQFTFKYHTQGACKNSSFVKTFQFSIRIPIFN